LKLAPLGGLQHPREVREVPIGAAGVGVLAVAEPQVLGQDAALGRDEVAEGLMLSAEGEAVAALARQLGELGASARPEGGARGRARGRGVRRGGEAEAQAGPADAGKITLPRQLANPETSPLRAGQVLVAKSGRWRVVVVAFGEGWAYVERVAQAEEAKGTEQAKGATARRELPSFQVNGWQHGPHRLPAELLRKGLGDGDLIFINDVKYRVRELKWQVAKPTDPNPFGKVWIVTPTSKAGDAAVPRSNAPPSGGCRLAGQRPDRGFALVVGRMPPVRLAQRAPLRPAVPDRLRAPGGEDDPVEGGCPRRTRRARSGTSPGPATAPPWVPMPPRRPRCRRAPPELDRWRALFGSAADVVASCPRATAERWTSSIAAKPTAAIATASSAHPIVIRFGGMTSRQQSARRTISSSPRSRCSHATVRSSHAHLAAAPLQPHLSHPRAVARHRLTRPADRVTAATAATASPTTTSNRATPRG
jgi:hypothetical protein